MPKGKGIFLVLNLNFIAKEHYQEVIENAYKDIDELILEKSNFREK